MAYRGLGLTCLKIVTNPDQFAGTSRDEGALARAGNAHDCDENIA